MARFSILALALFSLSGCIEITTSEKTQKATACFEVVTPKDSNTVKIDKCKGESWILVRTTIIGNDNKPTGEYAFRWRPILTFEGEALLSNN